MTDTKLVCFCVNAETRLRPDRLTPSLQHHQPRRIIVKSSPFHASSRAWKNHVRSDRQPVEPHHHCRLRRPHHAQKFEAALEPIDILKGQIDMVNLHSHVAAVSDKSPLEKAVKAAKLITASIAEMRVLKATEQKRARIDGPVVVVGNGISSFPAVQKITEAGIKCILSVPETDPDKIIRNLHLSYPGERAHYDRLKTLIKDTLNSKNLTVFESSRLTELVGVTGNYTLTFSHQNGQEEIVNAGAIIAALDAELSPPGPEFGYDGRSVLIQSEMEEHITQNGTPKGQVVFWISDYEYGMPELATLSAKIAWSMAMHMKACSPDTNIMIFHNEKWPFR